MSTRGTKVRLSPQSAPPIHCTTGLQGPASYILATRSAPGLARRGSTDRDDHRSAGRM